MCQLTSTNQPSDLSFFYYSIGLRALILYAVFYFKIFPVAIARRSHPFPFRTRKLRVSAAMVLSSYDGGRVARCRVFVYRAVSQDAALFLSTEKGGTENSNSIPCRYPRYAGSYTCQDALAPHEPPKHLHTHKPTYIPKRHAHHRSIRV